jgi:crossover junction endodeoxyribonuclease RusA
MTALPTATCPTCLTERSLTRAGNIRRHACEPVTAETIALPWHVPPLTQNQLRRLHPMREAALKRVAKDEARWTIRGARLTARAQSNVVLHWRMPDGRRRDGDGAAPTLKVVLDALVAEGILPDDSWAEVPHSGVTCHPPMRGLPGALWLELSVPVVESEAS